MATDLFVEEHGVIISSNSGGRYLKDDVELSL